MNIWNFMDDEGRWLDDGIENMDNAECDKADNDLRDERDNED